MTQYARPASDITTEWTTTPLWSKLDEVSPDDADFITGTGPTKTAEVKLSSVSDPNDHANHIWSLRLKATGSSAGEKVTVTLYQGSTSIEVLINAATITRNAFNLWTGTLANAANITDYTDLRIRLVTGSNGASETIQCSWIELAVPDIAAVQLTINDAAHMFRDDGPITLTAHVPTFTLTIEDAAHTHGDDGPISLIAHPPAVQLTIDDAVHTHGADGPVDLTLHIVLAIDDAAHTHGDDGPITITAHVPTFALTIDDATHTHGAEGPIDLTQHNILAIDDAAHTHWDEGPITLVTHAPSGVVLMIDDAAHTHADDGPITLTAYTPSFQLTIADATHTHGAEELQLVQHNLLAIDDSAHAHQADNVVLELPGGMMFDGMGVGMGVGMKRKINS